MTKAQTRGAQEHAADRGIRSVSAQTMVNARKGSRRAGSCVPARADEGGPVRRAPSGAAVLRETVTQAIRRATLKELARVGYARMSMEAVARRAGVGKAAIYRRWRTKTALVVAVISAVGNEAAQLPDTGTVRGDIRALLDANAALLRRPMTQRILADLMAETRRERLLEAALRAGVQDRRRAKGEEMLRRAIARRELRADLDVDLALDLLAAPLYWRIIAMRRSVSPAYLEQLTEMILAALGACVTPPT